MLMLLVLFDGYCNLCSASVRIIRRYDVKKQLSFMALQSDAAKNLLQGRGYQHIKIDSVVFVTDKSVYFKSDAAIEIAKLLSGLPRMLVFLRYIPKNLRDFVYDCIAKTRYTIFGKRSTCMV